MKLNVIFLISLGVNLLLVAGIGQHWSKTKQPVAEAVVERVTPVTGATAPLGTPVTNVVEVAGKPFHWAQLESEDYHRYVANLRAIGCPETTVQDILYYDVYKACAAKIRELNKVYGIDRQGKSANYWQVETAIHAALAARSRELLKLNLEKHRLLYSLLGVDMERTRMERFGLPDLEAAKVPFLAPNRVREAQEIMSRFVELDKAVSYKYAEYDGEERGLEKEALLKERDAELLKVMSAGELLEYKLRVFRQAESLRHALEAFEPTEQEFRMLFQLEEKHSAANLAFNRDDPAAQLRNDEEIARRRLEQRQLLGETRFQEYIRGQQSEYRDLNRLVQQNNLPKQTAAKVYDMQKAAENQIIKLRRDPTLSAQQQEQAVTRIRELTQKSVQGAVGDKVYELYKKTGGGYWLDGLGKPGSGVP
jgi:hypothetical protein